MSPPSGAQPLTFGNCNSYVPVEDLFLRGRGGEGMINTSTDRYQHQNIKDTKFILVLQHHPCVQLSPVCCHFMELQQSTLSTISVYCFVCLQAINISWCKGHRLHSIAHACTHSAIPRKLNSMNSLLLKI